ncbi:MAG TPA: BLUF domain-containing protein [Pseudomonas sp.]|nr:BLUF domain-containing protein [Pseudomonas sp.]
MLKSVIYVSKATSLQAVSHIREFLPRARAHNDAHSITGALLFDGEHFLQILEGPAAQIDALIARISSDARHSQVTLLAALDLPQRAFSGFSMGYLYEPKHADLNADLFGAHGLTMEQIWERAKAVFLESDRVN